MFRLYRPPVPLRYSAVLAAALLPSAAALAQMHHVDAPERITRAIGVYEWTGDLAKPSAARFVPVSLFIDGRFEDAGLYLARPVPFALQTGDLYSLERAGEPQGTLDLDFARRVVTGNALADDNTEGAWYGYGRFTLDAAPKLTPLRPSRHLSTLQGAGPDPGAPAKTTASDTDNSRPHMNRRDNGGSTGTPAPTAAHKPDTSSSTSQDTSAKPSTTDSTSTRSSSSDDDTDRPTLRRRDPSQDAARRRDVVGKKGTSGVTAAGPALGDDPDRPTLSRGSKQAEGTPELTGLPADLHQAVAVSDATHRDTHPFAREWETPAEKADTLAALAALARPRVAAYLATNALVPGPLPAAPAPAKGAPVTTAQATGQASAPIPSSATEAAATNDAAAPPKLQRGIPQQYQHPAPHSTATTSATAPAQGSSAAPAAPAHATNAPAATTHTASAATHRPAHNAARPTPAHPVPLTLAQEEIAGFTLSYGGLPTFVYTAAAGAVPATPGAAGPVPVAALVTVVAQRLPSGELQVVLNTITDSAHLDRSPRLRLIDAVDPDDSHRASLLFELRGNNSRQFALYRLTSARAEQTFTTASIE